MTIYLYVKTHNKTGLKYLGKTSKNPEMSHIKALKTWDGIYKKDYEKYKMAVSFIAEGKTNREITKLMKIDYATINKLRTASHRVFELFPEFKQLMGTEVL